METPNLLVRKMRMAAGLSQRALATRAGTSQPAIARYERGDAVPAWDTLQRIARACEQELKIDIEAPPDPHDVQLATTFLELTPESRLRTLRRFARLRAAAGGAE